MMRIREIVLLASFLTAASVLAEVPTVKALAAKAPKIDGVLDDECWKPAAPCEFVLTTGNAPSQKTVAKVCQDGWFLFVAFQCDESEMGKIIKGTTTRDDAHWSSDCVEIFLDAEGKGAAYAHFVVSAAGGIFDEWVKDAAWNAEWRAATRLEEKGWTAEIEIPFSSLRLIAAAGKTWRINFCREEQSHSENSSWAPVGETFHNPALFGRMEIDADLSRFHCALSLPGESYSVGSNTVSVEIDNRTDVERRGSVVITGAGPDGAEIARASRWLVMPPKAKSQCPVPVMLPMTGTYNLTIGLFQGDKYPVAVRRAVVEVPAIRFSPADARVRWIRHEKDGQVTLMVVHDCAYKSEEITFETPERTFKDRLDGYEVRVYRWASKK